MRVLRYWVEAIHARCHRSEPQMSPLRPPTPQEASPYGEEGTLVVGRVPGPVSAV